MGVGLLYMADRSWLAGILTRGMLDTDRQHAYGCQAAFQRASNHWLVCIVPEPRNFTALEGRLGLARATGEGHFLISCLPTASNGKRGCRAFGAYA